MFDDHFGQLHLDHPFTCVRIGHFESRHDTGWSSLTAPPMRVRRADIIGNAHSGATRDVSQHERVGDVAIEDPHAMPSEL